MSDDRHRRIVELFDAAAGLPAAERDAFLRRVCEDPTVRRTVQRMLEHDGRSLPLTGLASLRETLDALTGETAAPPAIDGLTIVRPLGTGGMGEVYEAEQRSPRRRVALKVMRRALVSRSAVRRFGLEAEVLSRLDHPGIARIHEAGMADDGFGGTPYFVMELVEGGEDIVAYARRRRLSLDERLRLVTRVCAAVGHGHELGVVHGDLKPANILVDAAGTPRVIDFGVARVTDADVTVTTADLPTRTILGTLQYASPEQCTGRPDDIDARSDVYALGLLLYELVTDRRPYELPASDLATAVATICHAVPPPPRVDGRPIDADLETVIRKAIAKDRRGRYRVAGELGDELERILADEPILARAATGAETMRRLIRSHRAAFAGATAAVVMLAVAAPLLLALWLGSQQALARLRAAERRTAEVAAGLWTTVADVVPGNAGRDSFRPAFDQADAARVDLQAGRVAAAANGFILALQAWEQAEARTRSNVDTLLRDAASAVQRDDFDAAERLIARAGSHRDVAEQRRELYRLWIDALDTRETREQARAVADRALAAFPDDETLLAAAARVRLLFLELVRIEPGTCVLGSEPGTRPIAAALPRRTVRIEGPLLFGRTEVTQGQFRALMGRSAAFWPGDLDRPAERVTWFDAVAFCNALSVHHGLRPRYRIEPAELDAETRAIAAGEVELLDGDGYRLPTDVEWEYACRAGTTTLYSFGDDTSAATVDLHMWYTGNSDGMTHPVASKRPNPWGLYDMHGSVWEWCADWWHPTYQGAPDDASAWIEGGDPAVRVIRGGSYHDIAYEARSAFRDPAPAELLYINAGFRVVRDADE